MKSIAAFVCLTLLLCSEATFAQPTSNDLYSLIQVKKGIKSKRVSSFDKSGGNNDRIENIAAGATKTLFDVKGAGVINHIWITIAPGPEALHRDDIILRMYWDGNTFPSVESPLGSFFGQGWNEAYPYYTLPLNAAPGDAKGLSCYFAMPFAKGARIEIENQNDRAIDAFYYYVDYYEMPQLPPDAGRFHAWFNNEVTDADSSERENEWGVLGREQGKNLSGKNNYLIADIQGQGHFVGVNYYVNSPGPIWYGEGDDMIFIDGSEMPTLNGTGTEDYFNTSWSPKEVFMTPYFGYPRVNTPDRSFQGGWAGRTHIYRFHIADPVYFDKSMRFTIEHGHNDVLTLELRTVAYWYQSEAAKLPHPIGNKTERALMPLTNPIDVHKWRNDWRQAHASKSSLWGNETNEK